MAHSERDVDAAVRKDLLALDDAEWAHYAWRETSKTVDALAGGGECLIHRWELPWGHPVRAQGSIHDDLVLGVDNVLRTV